MDILGGLGLALPAGLNAYIPLLTVALAQRFGWLHLREPYDALGEWWAIALMAVLLLVETVVDKVPAADHVNDAVNTFVRPAAGALLMVAVSGGAEGVHPVLLIAAGILVAGGVHVAKATARPAVNVTTAGVGTPFVSAFEDLAALVASIVALVAPVLVVLTAALLVWVVVRTRRRGRGRPLDASSGGP